MYGSDLNGKKITLSLLEVRVIEGSSYQRLGLVNVTVNVRRKSRGNRLRFELARGSSYRESAVHVRVQKISRLSYSTSLIY